MSSESEHLENDLSSIWVHILWSWCVLVYLIKDNPISGGVWVVIFSVSSPRESSNFSHLQRALSHSKGSKIPTEKASTCCCPRYLNRIHRAQWKLWPSGNWPGTGKHWQQRASSGLHTALLHSADLASVFQHAE